MYYIAPKNIFLFNTYNFKFFNIILFFCFTIQLFVDIINVTFYGERNEMSNRKEPNQSKIAILRDQGSLNPFPKKVRDILFLNEEFFDPNDIVQVKYELLRRVKIDGLSVTDAVKNFGFSRLSFYRILTIFNECGLAGFISKKRGPKKAHKITANVLKFLHNKIHSTPSIKINELKKVIKEKFGLSVHSRSIERALFRKKRRMI